MTKKIYWLFVFCFLLASSTAAAPPTSPYAPGQTLNPTCNPGTTNCTVTPASAAGANSDITSLSGLTTPLSVSQGGTGLSSGGSNGQFFKISNSNLPAWETVGLNNIDGTLSVLKGGTGLSTIGAGELLYANSANNLSPLALHNNLVINSGALEVNDSSLNLNANQISDFNGSVDERIILQKAQLNGLATLGADGKIPTDQLNQISVNNTFVVTSSANLTSLSALVGDLAVATSNNKTYVLQSLPASTLGNGIELLTPASVASVNSKTGAVDLTTTDIPEGTNLYFTDERSDDRVGALINDGIGIYKIYDDSNNTLSLNINESVLSMNNLGGTPLLPSNGGTGLSSISTGELIYGSGTNIFSSLGPGSTGQVLKINSGLPVWGTDSDTLYTAGTGLNLASNAFSVDQSVLNLNNFTGVLSVDKGGTGQTTTSTAFNALAPIQTGNNGKFLTTDGANVLWAAVPGGITDHLLLSNIGSNTHAQIDSHIINYSNPHQVTVDQSAPSQTGNNGKFLTTDGANVLWAAVPGGITDHLLLSNIGSNTHAQIDSHIINYSNPHQVTATQLGAFGIISEINTNGTTTIDWSKVSKSGSSLADLATKNYSDLSNRPADDDFHSLSSETAIANTDEVLIYSQADSGYRKMTRGNFVAGLGSGGSTAWSSLTTPTASLSLDLSNYKTSFNFGSATGVDNLFSLSDTASNSGTGYLFSAVTANGSSLKPLQVGAKGATYLAMSSSGETTFGTTTSNLKISNNGSLRLTGSAVAWEDLRVPMETSKAGGANDPTFVQITNNGAGSRGVYAYSFPTNTTARELFFSVQLPHAWLAGTDLHPHIHWVPADANTGNVVWGMECVWNNVNSDIGTTTLNSIVVAASGSKKHIIAHFPNMNGSGKDISSMLSCRIFRDSNNVLDTYNSAAYLLETDFHYMVDSFGSDSVGSKTY
ncbi:MAG: hypothetical protein PHR00_03820 [Patescibacteria group bacterium]|nr:hypothetical protein [Patescibacteria group bacterium]